MKLALLSSVVTFAALSIGATCNPPPPTPPTPDATDAVAPPAPVVDAAPALDTAPAPVITDASGPCVSACAALQAAGCSIGTHADCPTVEDRDLGSGKVANPATGKPLTCADVAKVKSRADAQRFGFVCQ